MDLRDTPPPQSSVEIDEPILAAEVPTPQSVARRRRRRYRRVVILPLVLFLVTCASTFYVGLWGARSWDQGLAYMLAVMGILLAHEMGHFLQAVRYHVPASLPFFIPFPLGPIGTMGAVIGMPGTHADRKQMFDIAISGPWAGLIVALPICWVGILNAPVFPAPPGTPGVWHFADPLLFKFLIALLRPDVPAGHELTMTPLLRAGWVGMLITGLNMMPVSQLDGGHVAYALFRHRAHLLARGILIAAIASIILFNLYWFILIVLLVTLIGTDHPPTRNDEMPLSRFRMALGLASLALPIICLTPVPFTVS